MLLHQRGVSHQVCEDVMLVLSELITNVISHTDSDTITCGLGIEDKRVQIEVGDRSRGRTRPRIRRIHPEDERGRGLLLVSALSTRWGVKDATDGTGRTVWAELARG